MLPRVTLPDSFFVLSPSELAQSLQSLSEASNKLQNADLKTKKIRLAEQEVLFFLSYNDRPRTRNTPRRLFESACLIKPSSKLLFYRQSCAPAFELSCQPLLPAKLKSFSQVPQCALWMRKQTFGRQNWHLRVWYTFELVVIGMYWRI